MQSKRHKFDSRLTTANIDFVFNSGITLPLDAGLPRDPNAMANANMKLTSFRVTNFRSVNDSGWIETDDVSALIGTNESGKTNLLLPLWKLKPAKDGEINLIADAPRAEYNNIRNLKDKPVFITARFMLLENLAAEVAAKSGALADSLKTVEVSRDLDGKYKVHFPKFNPHELAARKADLDTLFEKAASEIETLSPSGKGDETLKADVLGRLTKAREVAQSLAEFVETDGIGKLQAEIAALTAEQAPAKSTIAPRYAQVVEALASHAARLAKGSPDNNSAVIKMITDCLPSFVYYSTYGNLDSEIYLPRVIEDMKRTDLTGKAEARARTLRVLFDFVKLKPEEILELGKDWNEAQGKMPEAEFKKIDDKKKQRSILLQSASTDLTRKFREWWKQGNYRFSFGADGNHFRIWVSDDVRAEQIELELRSTGLQWFLSFYLVFLVESKSTHNGAILLLDEPGLSLHPLAQRDLSVFFDNLAASNQLLYTTHSPFLVDSDHLDRVRNVFMDEKGHTVASPDLRAGPVAAQSKSVYAVHASLGLSVSDTLLQGCRPIVVEGLSDQVYMSAIKNVLVRSGQLNMPQELVFVPGKGAKAIKAIVSILGARDNDLPVVLLDGDHAGREVSKDLKNGLYGECKDRVMMTTDFRAMVNGEIEDLLPRSVIVMILDRYLKGPVEQPFAPEDNAPIVPQVKEYAVKHNIELAEGWKVEVARMVKARLAAMKPTDAAISGELAGWAKLMASLAPEVDSSSRASSKAKTHTS